VIARTALFSASAAEASASSIRPTMSTRLALNAQLPGRVRLPAELPDQEDDENQEHDSRDRPGDALRSTLLASVFTLPPGEVDAAASHIAPPDLRLQAPCDSHASDGPKPMRRTAAGSNAAIRPSTRDDPVAVPPTDRHALSPRQ